MKIATRCTLLLTTALCCPQLHAWMPGVTAPTPLSGLSVDTTNRNDVISFFQNVYQASEGYESVMNWTGDHATCSEGTVSSTFVDMVQRRVNYYRAMA